MAGMGTPASGDPHVERELAERGRALIAAAVADTSVPLALRERIERDRERARPVVRRRWLGLGASFAAVAAAAATAIVISLGGTASPGVLATVELAGKGPALPAPKHDAAHPALLKAQIDGLPFPDWNAQFKWSASGGRRGEIKGRHATTAYYDGRLGTRLAY